MLRFSMRLIKNLSTSSNPSSCEMQLKNKRTVAAVGTVVLVTGCAFGLYRQQKRKSYELHIHHMHLRRLVTGDEDAKEYAKSKYIYVPMHGPGLDYVQEKLEFLSPTRLLLQARGYSGAGGEQSREVDLYTKALIARQRLIDEALSSPLFYQWSAAGAVQIAKGDPFVLLGLLRSGGSKLSDLSPFVGPPKFTFFAKNSKLDVVPSLQNTTVLRDQFGDILEHVAQQLLPKGHAVLRTRALNSLRKLAAVKNTGKNTNSADSLQKVDEHTHLPTAAHLPVAFDDEAEKHDADQTDVLADFTFAERKPADAAFLMIIDAVARCSEVSEIAAHFPHTSLVFLLDALLATHQLSPETQRNIAKLIGNIACYMTRNEDRFINDVLRSRVIAFLVHAVMEERDVELSLRASKALANLDCLNWDGTAYAHGIYLLHPLSRVPPESIVADVVFVHGLKGGALKTWRQNDRTRQRPKGIYTRCWPRDWLPHDVPNVRVIAVDFESTFTGSDHLFPDLLNSDHPANTIESRATEFLYKLQLAGIGDRPIIWCSHSMGGLIVKQLLLAAANRPHSPLNNIFTQTKGIVFYSTPHLGSPMATKFVRSYAPVSREVVDLCEKTEYLQKLHDDFMQLYQSRSIKLLSFCEGTIEDAERSLWRVYSSLLGAVSYVPLSSANPMSGDFILLPDDSHFTSCKPKARDSIIYTEFIKYLQLLVKELAPKTIGGTIAQEQVESQHGLVFSDEFSHGVNFNTDPF